MNRLNFTLHEAPGSQVIKGITTSYILGTQGVYLTYVTLRYLTLPIYHTLPDLT